MVQHQLLPNKHQSHHRRISKADNCPVKEGSITYRGCKNITSIVFTCNTINSGSWYTYNDQRTNEFPCWVLYSMLHHTPCQYRSSKIIHENLHLEVGSVTPALLIKKNPGAMTH